MLRNHLLIIWRNFRRQPLYSILNISGLAISIAAALLIMLYLHFELNYDKVHTKADRIYRVTTPTIVTHEKSMNVNWNNTHALLGPYAKQDYSEVDAYVRFYQFFRGGSINFEYQEQLTESDEIFATDSNALEVFNFDLIAGNKNTALHGPNKIILEKSLAQTIFGDNNPIGQSLACNIPHNRGHPKTDYNLTVTGVYEDLPDNSYVNAKALISAATDPELNNYYFNMYSFTTFFLLHPEVKPTDFAPKLSEMYDNYLDPEREPVLKRAEHSLQPLQSIHLAETHGYTYIYIFSGIAILLLLISGISYVNLATAQSSKRALEVGLRKVMGSSRKNLIGQYLTESMVFTALSIGLGILLLNYTIHPLNIFLDLNLDFAQLGQPTLLLGILGILFLLGILGGAYPAFFLSSFEPIAALKGQFTQSGKKYYLRKALVGTQLAVVIFVLACTAMIYSQMQFIRQKHLGFDQEQVIILNQPASYSQDKAAVLKNKLLENPQISSVANSSFFPGVDGMIRGPIDAETEKGHVQQFVHRGAIGYDFLETMDIPIVEGRNFSSEFPSDSLNSCIINQAFVANFGLENPLGKKIRFGDKGNPHFFLVVGVVEDFHQGSLHDPISSQFFSLAPSTSMAVKLNQNTEAGLQHIEKSWSAVYAEAPLDFQFLDELVQRNYEADQIRGAIFSFFAILTLIISLMGLFGLSSFLALQRVKEIGIRKVLGAGVSDLVLLVSRDFLILVFLAAIPAFALAWYVIQQWLQNFAFRAELNLGLLAIVLLLTLLLTLLTTGGQAFRAARLNPADTLKTE